MAITAISLLLVVVIGAAVLAPFLYVVITWDHDIACTYVCTLWMSQCEGSHTCNDR